VDVLEVAMAEYHVPEFDDACKAMAAKFEALAFALGLFDTALRDAIYDPLGAEIVIEDILDAEEIG